MFLIESEILAVEILPQVGGKVGQIRLKPLGSEILVPQQKPYCTIPPEASWLDFDTSGMDDCFPNIAAGNYPDGAGDSGTLPDLGEWTRGSWQVLEASHAAINLRRDGYRFPYTAFKTIRFATADTLEFLYRVESRASVPMRYMWSAHPLIRVPGIYRLTVLGDRQSFCTFPSDGIRHEWPHWQATDLSCEWIPRGTTLKIFLTGLTDGWCALQLPEYTLRFEFDIDTTPVLGVWFDNYGFPTGSGNPFRCIAIEPCTSPSDLLDSLDAAEYPVLSSGSEASWSFRLQITPAAQ